MAWPNPAQSLAWPLSVSYLHHKSVAQGIPLSVYKSCTLRLSCRTCNTFFKCSMCSWTLAEYIKISSKKIGTNWSKYSPRRIVHHARELRGGIGKPKWHYHVLKKSPPHLECCLVNISGSNRYLPISWLEVDLVEHLGVTHLFQAATRGHVRRLNP